MTTRHRNLLAFAALAVLATGCEADRPLATSVRPTFDAVRTHTDLTTADTILNSPNWASLLAVVQHLPARHLGPAMLGEPSSLALLLDRSSPERARQLALTLPRRILAAHSRANSQAMPVLPADALGKTFIYDAATDRYVVDPTRTGAPGNGVRYILYAINPVTGEPLVGQEIGYADYLDEGRSLPNGVALRLVVVSKGVTYLDYSLSLVGTLQSVTVGVKGFIRGHTNQLAFRIDVVAHGPGQAAILDVDFAFELPALNFRATGVVHGATVDGGGNQTVDLAVQVGSDLIEVSATQESNGLNARFKVNGALFATATGDPKHPVIRGADGSALTADELTALQGIVGLTDGVFKLLGNLLAPASALAG